MLLSPSALCGCTIGVVEYGVGLAVGVFGVVAGVLAQPVSSMVKVNVVAVSAAGRIFLIIVFIGMFPEVLLG